MDELKITSQGTNQTYLYNHGKPLVAIWGLGFPDRPYNIRNIGIERLIDFLKHDPQYGGCAVMLGVPTYFRDLDIDCLPDPYIYICTKSWRRQISSCHGWCSALLPCSIKKWHATPPMSGPISPGVMPGTWNTPPAFIRDLAGTI